MPLEDSEEEDYSDRTSSEDESDEDAFMKFASDNLQQSALLTADSISDLFFPRTTQIILEYQRGKWVPRLREPRDLFGVSSSGPLSPTRWPYHCEVIDEKVQHIAILTGLRSYLTAVLTYISLKISNVDNAFPIKIPMTFFTEIEKQR